MANKLLALAGVLAATVRATTTTHHPPSCSNIPTPHVPGAKVLSVTSTPLTNFTVPATPPLLSADVPNINVCAVTVALTHPGANDTVTFQIWLPLQTSAWNNRLLSLGGSAWAAGIGPLALAPYAVQGFAAGATDAGLDGNLVDPSGWALKADGTVNTALLENFASRSIHELAVVGKAVTESYYGRKAEYSYWQGCSTGGRQGMVAAQKYPRDFDGIVAGAPAIYWTKYVIAELWPQVVMSEVGYWPQGCELAAVREDAVAACDGLDGVKDGVISDLGRCKYDPKTFVGKKIDCAGTEVVASEKLVEVARKIWEGPKTASGSRLWYGLNIGAPFATLAKTEDGHGAPFFVPATWAADFVEANPRFNVSGLDSAGLRELFDKSVAKFNDLIDSSNPDLSGFKEAGGKLLVWHGEADDIIFPQATIQYRKEVEKKMGISGRRVDDFFRLFMAPGVDHCAGGAIDGAGPTDPLASVIAWVEKNKAPNEIPAATLPTAKTQFTRKLCPYPQVARYEGHGDPTKAASYRCGKAPACSKGKSV
jgi:pimeloyl-ACP methyl ester carboxylesterase